jgi:hypothetical protein
MPSAIQDHPRLERRKIAAGQKTDRYDRSMRPGVSPDIFRHPINVEPDSAGIHFAFLALQGCRV